MDFAGVYLIKELHHDKGVEDDGVVLGWRGVERGVTATVNVKDLLAYTWTEQLSYASSVSYLFMCDAKVVNGWLHYSAYQQRAAWRWWWADRLRVRRCSWSWCWRWVACCDRMASSSAKTRWEAPWPEPERQRCPWSGSPTASALPSEESPEETQTPLGVNTNTSESLFVYLYYFEDIVALAPPGSKALDHLFPCCQNCNSHD